MHATWVLSLDVSIGLSDHGRLMLMCYRSNTDVVSRPGLGIQRYGWESADDRVARGKRPLALSNMTTDSFFSLLVCFDSERCILSFSYRIVFFLFDCCCTTSHF